MNAGARPGAACALRPLAAAGGFYALFAFLCYKALPAALMLLAALFALQLCLPRARRFLPRLAFWAGAAALAAFALWEWAYFDVLAPCAGTDVTLEGLCVEEATDADGFLRHETLRVTAVNGRKLLFPLKVRLYGDTVLSEGDLFHGGFEVWENGAMKGEGVAACARCLRLPARTGRADNLSMELRTMRRALAAAVEKAVGGPLAPVAAAMAAGERRGVPAAVENAFRGAGLTHLLVVSGLHLTAAAGFAAWVLGCLRASAVARSLWGCGLTLAYMAVTGFTPSVVRAGVMVLLALSAPLFGRESDGPTSLGAAALVLLLPQPWAVTNVGLLLSFGCVAALLFSGALMGRKGKGRSAAGQALMHGVMIQLFTLPVVCCTFGTLPLAAPLAGLLAIPLAAPVLVCGLGAGLLGLLGLSGPAAAVGFFARAAVQLLYAVALAAAKLPWAAVRLEPLPAVAGAFCALLLALAVMSLGGSRAHLKGLAAGAALLSAVAFGGAALSAGTVEAVLWAGGESAVVSTGGRAVVFWNGSFRDLADMVYYTRARGLETVLLAGLSCGDDTLAQGAGQLCARGTFRAETAPTGAVWRLAGGVRLHLQPRGGAYALLVDTGSKSALLCLGAANLSGLSADYVLARALPDGAVGGALALQTEAAAGEGLFDRVFVREGNLALRLRPGGGGIFVISME